MRDASWDNTTWEGARLEQLRRWRALPLKIKLQAVDGLRAFDKRLHKQADLSATNPLSSVSEKSSEYNT